MKLMLIRLISGILLLVVMPSCLAADGWIQLFADYQPADYSSDIPPYTPINIFVSYGHFEDGPNGIQGMEFMIESSEDYVIFLGEEFWRDEGTVLTNGSVSTGISLVTSVCVGIDEYFVYMGYFSVLSFQAIGHGCPSVLLRVLPSPNALEEGIWVVACDENNTLHEVRGAWFCFPANASECRWAVETSSWGVIKSLYR